MNQPIDPAQTESPTGAGTIEPGIYEVRLQSQTFRVIVLKPQPSNQWLTAISFAHHTRLLAETLTRVGPISQEDATVLLVMDAFAASTSVVA